MLASQSPGHAELEVDRLGQTDVPLTELIHAVGRSANVAPCAGPNVSAASANSAITW
jgi:hypothetical protein